MPGRKSDRLKSANLILREPRATRQDALSGVTSLPSSKERVYKQSYTYKDQKAICQHNDSGYFWVVGL